MATICHGLLVLAAADVLGEELHCLPSLWPGWWTHIPADEAMVDGNLVTAPAWPAISWLAEFLKLLGTDRASGNGTKLGICTQQ